MAKSYMKRQNKGLEALKLSSSPVSKKIQDISIDRIRENPNNEAIWHTREEDVRLIADGISRRGFEGAIGLYDMGDGTYEIYSGHLRMKAMMLLGKPSIPAVIKPYPDSQREVWDDLISSNMDARKMTVMEQARAIMAWQENVLKADPGYSGNTSRDLAEHFNMSVANVTNLKALLKLIPVLQEKADNGVSYATLVPAAQLSEEDQLKFNDMLEAALADIRVGSLSRTDAVKMVKEIKDTGTAKVDRIKVHPFRKSCESFLKALTKQNLSLPEEDAGKIIEELEQIQLMIGKIVEENKK